QRRTHRPASQRYRSSASCGSEPGAQSSGVVQAARQIPWFGSHTRPYAEQSTSCAHAGIGPHVPERHASPAAHAASRRHRHFPSAQVNPDAQSDAFMHWGGSAHRPSAVHTSPAGQSTSSRHSGAQAPSRHRRPAPQSASAWQGSELVEGHPTRASAAARSTSAAGLFLRESLPGQEITVDAKRTLQQIGSEVSNDFAKSRTILSFEEYLKLFAQEPRRQSRNAAQYLKDVIDHFGAEQVPHPTGSGKIRRFKIFDLMESDRDGRVAGQEEVQNAIYRLLGNFVRAGRINKLLFLHGPNGSAKSSIVDSLKRGMEQYSELPQGALYKINWVFPTEKLIKGSIGFGEKLEKAGELASYAHLEVEHIDMRQPC